MKKKMTDQQKRDFLKRKYSTRTSNGVSQVYVNDSWLDIEMLIYATLINFDNVSEYGNGTDYSNDSSGGGSSYESSYDSGGGYGGDSGGSCGD